MPRFKLVDGVRIQFTADEETARDNEEAAYAAAAGTRALANLREQRNIKLAETDIWGLSDFTMSAEMTAYREKLRNLPAEHDTSDSSALAENLSNLVWPTKP
jgi:hypothetical protein